MGVVPLTDGKIIIVGAKLEMAALIKEWEGRFFFSHDRSNPWELRKRTNLTSVLHPEGDLPLLWSDWVKDLKCFLSHLAPSFHLELWAPGGSLWGLVVLLPLHRWSHVSSGGSSLGLAVKAKGHRALSARVCLGIEVLWLIRQQLR